MRILLVALALVGLTLPASADRYRFQIKTSTGGLPVGEVARAADGTITTKGLTAPSIDKVADALVADWARYKVPASIEITRYLPDSSYMHNTSTKRTVTFTPSDALFKVAVLERFLAARKLDALGMSSIDFIIHDVEGGNAHAIEVVDDGGVSYTNFRKNTTLRYDSGHLSFFISTIVRPTAAGAPGPVSPTNSKLALAKQYDSGGVLIAWIDLAQDGSVTIHPYHTAERFETQVASTLAADSISVPVYDAGEYKYLAVAKTDKHFFEAAI